MRLIGRPTNLAFSIGTQNRCCTYDNTRISQLVLKVLWCRTALEENDEYGRQV
jgi:hypothetical protein